MADKKSKYEKKLNEINIDYALQYKHTLTPEQKEGIQTVMEKLELMSATCDMDGVAYNYMLNLEKNIVLTIGYHYGINSTFNIIETADLANKYLVLGQEIKDIDTYTNDKNLRAFSKSYVPLDFSKDLSIFKNNTKIEPLDFLDRCLLTDIKVFKYDKYNSIINRLNFNVSDYQIFTEEERATITNVYRQYVGVIKKVYEIDNKRMALIYSPYNEDLTLVFDIPTREHSTYNYLDENRVVSVSTYNNNTIYCLDIVPNLTFKMFELYYKSINIASHHTSLFLRDIPYISFKEIATGSSKYLMEEQKAEQEEKIRRMKNEKYKLSIQRMDETHTFIKNNMVFTDTTLSYEGISFDVTGLFSFKKMLEQSRIDEIEDYNTIINNVLTGIGLKFGASDSNEGRYSMDYNFRRKYYSSVDNLVLTSNSCSLTLDGKTVVLSKVGSSYKLNDIRINKKELGECLTHILCHKTIESYNEFLKTVSKCSLKFTKAISNNIKGTLNYNRVETPYEIKVIRDKSRNFVVLGKEKFAIKDSNGLIDFVGLDLRNRSLNLATTTEVPLTRLDEFFGDAFKRAQKAMAKSRELLDKTVKQLDTPLKTINGRTGYYVKGSSGKEYLVEDVKNDQPKTWEIQGQHMDYRCIVNKSDANQVGKDALVARLYALKNDSYVAQNIYTLKV